jgi:hypothetical protein
MSVPANAAAGDQFLVTLTSLQSPGVREPTSCAAALNRRGASETYGGQDSNPTSP